MKETLGSYAYAGQFQQRPAPAGGGMLKWYWWWFWQPKGANLPPILVRLPDGTVESRMAIERPDHFDQQIQSWDMAVKDNKNSDYVVGLVMAALGADPYLLDLTRDRLDLPDTISAIRQLSAKWPETRVKLIEDKANGPAVIQSLKHQIPGLMEVNPEGGKISRAAAASPQLESGNWYLPHPRLAPWVDAFMAECAAFPNGAYDDQVDAWSQGAKRLLHHRAKSTNPPFMPLPRRNYGRNNWMMS